ncbi:class I SAM-dependent DNA methyltransferase [Agrococcus sp. Ld7]|uniref:HsdM family class I SAM-dependent methyltransferase n=1 Tax=Agrococcus sp. Ld7 TaxID=649148 RepID=UPI00386DF074
MLSTELRVAVDRAWDGVWSSGVTNPITVSDLLGTILMVADPRGPQAWDRLATAVDANDAGALSEVLATVRRAHGMEPGAEVESPEFWKDAEPARRAMEALRFLREQSLGTDVLGDIYEHVLSKLGLAGQFGQFRTPRHLVEFMVQVADPEQDELVLDPACGTGGFLVAASDYRRARGRAGRYEGAEIDRTVARIASANLAFHDVAGGDVMVADGLSATLGEADVILANPPFAGAVSDEVISRFTTRSKKTELLFLERMMKLLRPGGRAVVVVPYGVVTGSSGAGSAIREMLVRGNSLAAVIELPSGVFRPYTDVKTAILVWRAEPDGAATQMVRVANDGFSLDARREPIGFNDLPEAIAVVRGQDALIAHRCVPTEEIVAAGLNLNPSRYLGDADAASVEHVDSEDVLAALGGRLQLMLDRVVALKQEVAS